MKLCERGEKLIASCIERQAMGHLRGLLADVKREAAAFCATIESSGPYFTVEDERAMARELQPAISGLQETLAHLDRASRSARSGRPGLTLLPFSDDRKKTARTRRSSQFLRTSL